MNNITDNLQINSLVNNNLLVHETIRKQIAKNTKILLFNKPTIIKKKSLVENICSNILPATISNNFELETPNSISVPPDSIYPESIPITNPNILSSPISSFESIDSTFSIETYNSSEIINSTGFFNCNGEDSGILDYSTKFFNSSNNLNEQCIIDTNKNVNICEDITEYSFEPSNNFDKLNDFNELDKLDKFKPKRKIQLIQPNGFANNNVHSNIIVCDVIEYKDSYSENINTPDNSLDQPNDNSHDKIQNQLEKKSNQLNKITKNNQIEQTHNSNNKVNMIINEIIQKKLYKMDDIDDELIETPMIINFSKKVSENKISLEKIDKKILGNINNQSIQYTMDNSIKENNPQSQTQLHNTVKFNESNESNESIITNDSKSSNGSNILYESDDADKFIDGDINLHLEFNIDDIVIISNLALISKLKEGEKIFINMLEKTKIKSEKINFEINIDNSYIPMLSRRYYNQGKKKSIESINKLIKCSIDQCEYYKSIKSYPNINKYYKILDECKIGLNNLINTYKTNEETVRSIENIIDEINRYLNLEQII
jgi:hypothetical protein